MNFDEWFLRERFMASTPLQWHYRRYDRAVHSLKKAQLFVRKNEATSGLAADTKKAEHAA
ncbi:MAG: hypothetical protein ACREVZ_07620 [Burkholderiales bacterium]